MEKVLFQERQHFRQAGIWVLVIFTDLIVLVSLAYSVWIHPESSEFTSFAAITGSLILCLLLTFFFLKTSMETKITKQGFSFRFTLLQRKPKVIMPGEIKKWEVRNVKPLLEYGGYGIRKSRRGMAYLVSGKQAVIFGLQSGKRITVGTQKPEMIKMAITHMLDHQDHKERQNNIH